MIEDAAQSFGAVQKSYKSCGVENIDSTSFFPAKPLGCYGDGGALFTNDDQYGEENECLAHAWKFDPRLSSVYWNDRTSRYDSSSLPFHPSLTQDEQDCVIQALKEELSHDRC